MIFKRDIKQFSELKLEIERKKLTIRELKQEIAELREMVDNYKQKKPYKNYDYAILIKKGEYPICAFWNNDKFEKDIKRLSYEHIAGELPIITIVK